MPNNQADQLLIQRIRQRDEQAWEEFIAKFEGRLLAFVDARLNNRTTSEDVVQEAFVGFLTSLPNYDDRLPLETYLFSITAHKLTDVLRRQGRRPTVPLMPADSDVGPREPVGRARVASSIMRSRERRGSEDTVIRECLAELIQGWRHKRQFERLQCIELLLVLGWANKAVAARLGITEQAVANHKHFVVSKLKDAATRAKLSHFELSDYGIR